VAVAPEERAVTVEVFREGQVFQKKPVMGEGELESVTLPSDPAPTYSRPAAMGVTLGPPPSPLGPNAVFGQAVGAMPAPVPYAVAPSPIQPAAQPSAAIKQLGLEATDAETGAGVRVTGVMGGSRAEAAGLRAGDIIVKVGGADVGNLVELQTVLAKAAPQASVILRVVRDGRLLKLTATVGEGELEGVTPVQRP